jgi:tripartite-type tricarboxylate transporter receptor subunit TctC
MHLSRRRLLHLAGAGGALAAASRRARAQVYPSRPLRWIVGFPPGGGADIVSRIMAPWLAERLGQPVVIENKPGASSNISIQAVVNAPPDGYTLLFVPASAAVNVSLFDNLPFNLLRDIAPVSGLIDFPLVMVANPSLPAQTIAELIAYAKEMMTGTNMIHVPYRGGAPMVADLIGGQVQVAFDVLTGSLAHVRSGSLRALGMAGKHRSDALPQVPTIGETVAGYEANSWCGVGVPRGTPAEIIARLNRETNAGLANPAVRARLAEVATTPIVFSPDEFGAYMASEVEKWGKVVRLAGIRPE